MNFIPNIFSLLLDNFPSESTKKSFDENNQEGFFLSNSGKIEIKKVF